MTQDTVILRRDDLYKLVWSEPVHTLAKNYGLSDVGLAKICRRMGIPLPGRGYWTMKRSGKTMPVTPLPPANETTVREVRIYKREKEVRQESFVEEPEIIKNERLPENLITVTQRLYKPDVLTEITEKALRKAEPDDWGRLKAYGQGCLDVRVSRGSVHRALLIFDFLIKALNKRGYVVSAKPRGTKISILEEPIDIRLVESTKRSERVLTREELIKKESDPYFYFHNRYLYTPTGKLSIVTGYYGSQTLCSDGKKHILEDSLNECVIGLIKIASEMKEIRAKRAREELEWEEARLRREEGERKLREEEARFRDLLKDATDWNSSLLIKQYIDAIEKTVIGENWEIESGVKMQSWLGWAKEKGNLLDPIASGRLRGQVLG
jgi:hypothetical protein